MPSLVVLDDDDALRALLATYLQRAGYTVYPAATGDMALRLCQEHRVDLVISDLVRPAEDPVHTLRELRQLTPAPKLLILTSVLYFVSTNLLPLAGHYQVDRVLGKPVLLAELLATIQDMLGGGMSGL
ncbi:MAG: response regulator [Candidatus Tectimicrobiota bacterium]